MIKMLTSQPPVVHTYAACAIDKILLLKNVDPNPTLPGNNTAL